MLPRVAQSLTLGYREETPTETSYHKSCITLEGHTDSVWSVSFSPSGDILASGSGDGTVRLWAVSDRQLLNTLSGHIDGVTSVSASKDGRWMASGSVDGTIRLWGVVP